MNKAHIAKLHTEFEGIVQQFPGSGTEFWCARDLQVLLGYSKWENFAKVIDKAITACETAGNDPKDHFAHISKMVDLGSGAKREIEDIALSRYASYLVAQNGDASKEPIAFAQTYFAVQTRNMELIEKRLAETDRVSARKRLSHSEKELSGIIFEHLRDDECFARIRSRGDQALFGGISTREMKDRLEVPPRRPLADFLPTITIKAKDLANEITNFNIKQNELSSESGISDEHVKNNFEVRNLLVARGIIPENLPPAEDVRKLERRLLSEEKIFALQAKPLEPPEEDQE